MKKIIVSTLIATSIVFGANTSNKNEVKLPFDLAKIENVEVKSYLDSIQSLTPVIATVIHDYYAVKYCDDDFYINRDLNAIENEVKELGASSEYGILLGSKTSNPSSYEKNINNLRYMNCGIDKSTSKNETLKRESK